MFDVAKVRKDFPILEEQVYGKRLVYLDNGATTQRPLQVIEKMNEYYLKYNSNVHRGVHFLSNKCTDANEEAREIVRKFIHAGSDKEIIFTRGTTESINLVAFSFGEAFIREGDEILVNEMEHHANIVPWQMAAQRAGLILRVAPINERGELILEELDKLLTAKTKLLTLAHISNVLGTINPVKEIIKMAHKKGIRVLIDGAQAVAHSGVNVADLDADFYVFSGHKIYGPTGIGVLYGKSELLEELPPYQGGGEMIQNVTYEKTTYNELPYKFEAGTQNIAGVIGFGKALEYINHIHYENIENLESKVFKYLDEELNMKEI